MRTKIWLLGLMFLASCSSSQSGLPIGVRGLDYGGGPVVSVNFLTSREGARFAGQSVQIRGFLSAKTSSIVTLFPHRDAALMNDVPSSVMLHNMPDEVASCLGHFVEVSGVFDYLDVETALWPAITQTWRITTVSPDGGMSSPSVCYKLDE